MLKDKLVFKKNKTTWDKILISDMLKQKESREKDETDYKKYIKFLRKLIPINITVGLIALITYFILFGATELARVVLSWTIGATLIGTFVSLIIGKQK